MKVNVEDVSQSTNIYEIAEVIQALNPEVQIRVGDMYLDPLATRRIYSSVPLDRLVLPEGYYTDDRDITNRHRTRTGLYCSIQVEDLALADRRYLKPKYDVTKTTNISEIAEVLQELNPDAEIRLGDARVDSQAARRLYSSIPLEDLVLPYGLYMHDDNTLTNKHRTENGIYCLLRVEDLALADESKLMPRVHRIISRDVPTTNDQKQTVKQIVLGAIIRLLNRAIDKVSDMYVKTRCNSNTR